MSALGQKRTCAMQNLMSALPPKADIASALAHVCFGQKRTRATQQKGSLFDHLVERPIVEPLASAAIAR
jgi:hypothetical protein